MGKLCTVTSCLLLTAAVATAQTAPHTQLDQRVLPQWLTGIIAVAAFLFLAFVTLLVKKAWCEKPNRGMSAVSERDAEVDQTDKDDYDTSLEMVRSRKESNGYDNMAMDNSDIRVTTM